MSVIDSAKALSVFESLNRTRIERLGKLLPLKSHFFLEILPLLFQTNNPMLPGYIDQSTPFGIVDYRPSNAALDAAKMLNHAFVHKHRALRYYPVRGLYLINDNGLLNYHTDIQFELWLVHVQTLTAVEFDTLQQKIDAVGDWAYAAFRIKLKGRLLNEAVLNLDISAFDRDRFYLASLFLAGLPPAWWSVPPVAPNDLLNSSQRHERHNYSVLDFGALASTAEDASLLLNRTIDQLKKAMDSDLESCLMLIFQSVQLQHYADFLWLSDELKRAVYSGVTDPMLLDSNNLKLGYITQFCNDPEMLFLAQQSFYILSRERLSQTVSLALYPWRRLFIEQQYITWQWLKSTLHILDKRDTSHYRQVLNEFQAVRLQISNAMQTVFLFAQQYKLNIEKAKQELEKKSNVLFNSDLDVINCLPLSFKPHNHEDQLYLARTELTDNWQINDLPANLSTTPLYQHPSLLNVLVWAINNQLLTNATRLQLIDQRQKIKMSVVLDLVQQLLRSPLKTAVHQLKPSNLGSAAEVDFVLLFANLEHQTTSLLSQQGLDVASLQVDPLNYANKKQSLIASVEALIYSSWGQLHYVISTDETPLLEVLSTIIQWQPKKQSALKTTCWCPSDNHGQKIGLRIESIYSEVVTHYAAHPLSGDYLIVIADLFYRLQWQQGLVDILPLTKNKLLEQHLAEERDVFSATKLDPFLDKEGQLQQLLNQQVEKQVSLFLLSKGDIVTLYIVDDLGSLFIQHTTDLTAAVIVSHYQAFFKQIKAIDDVQFFHLTHSITSGWKSSKITNFTIPANKSSYLPVRVELDSAQKDAQCTIYCGSKTFSGKANDPKLFKQVNDLILNLPNVAARHPLYINQLSFTDQKLYTTRHYILLKQSLEILLNNTENLSL